VSPSGEPEVEKLTNGASRTRLVGRELYSRIYGAQQKFFARPAATAFSPAATAAGFAGTISRGVETVSRLTGTASRATGTSL
jgi:hypothetical protein